METPKQIKSRYIDDFNELIRQHYPDAKISVQPIRNGFANLVISNDTPPEITLYI